MKRTALRRSPSAAQKKKLAWRAKRKAELMAGEARFTFLNGIVFYCPLGEHWMRREQVELCHDRCNGMRGDGDTDANTFLGCRRGNRAQGSVSLEDYLKLPLEVRRKNCGF